MRSAEPASGRLGTLGFHVDGRPCRVRCSYCYLGARPRAAERSLAPALVAEAAQALPARELAISVSEPAKRWRRHVEALAEVADRRRLPLAVTTTAEVLRSAPWLAPLARRVTISVDPEKGTDAVSVPALAEVAGAIARPGLEVVALVSLVSPEFCARLAAGLLADIVAIPALDAVGMNGLKPPPPWCDRAMWMRLLARLRPLLDRHLGGRLHLDCYVSARILGLSGCPAKPDIAAGREFRACVYQREPDFTFESAEELARRVAGYRAPAICPFPIV